jgi:hypothetical protein
MVRLVACVTDIIGISSYSNDRNGSQSSKDSHIRRTAKNKKKRANDGGRSWWLHENEICEVDRQASGFGHASAGMTRAHMI